MKLAWLGHHHGPRNSLVHRLPASVKLGGAFAVILGTVLAPPDWGGWYVGVALLLAGVTALSRVPPLFLLKRLALLSPSSSASRWSTPCSRPPGPVGCWS